MRFLGDVELGHDLDAADDLRVVRLGNGLHRPRESAVDAVLDDDFFVPGLDVDVRSAPVERVVDGGVHETDDRARGVGEPVDGERLLALVDFADDLHVEALGGFLEHPLRALALLEQLLDGGVRAHRGPDGHLQHLASSSSTGTLVGSGVTTISFPFSFL